MAFGDIDDESQAETNSLNHSIDHRENEKCHKPKWNIPTRRQRLWRILKCIAFVVIAALALVAFCMSLHDHIVISTAFLHNGPKASKQFSRSSIDALQAQIEKLNMTLTQRVDNHYEEGDAHHEFLNNTIHVKHSDLVNAVKEIKEEFNTNLSELNATLLLQIGIQHRESLDTIADLDQSMRQIRADVQNNKNQLDSQLSSLQTNIQSLETQLSRIDTAASQRDSNNNNGYGGNNNNGYGGNNNNNNDNDRKKYNSASYNRVLNPWLLVVGVYSVIMMI